MSIPVSPGGGQSHGAAGCGGQDQREDIWQAENLFPRSGESVHAQHKSRPSWNNGFPLNPLHLTSPQSQFKDVNDADLKAMDGQISELSTEVRSITQSCRELDAGGGAFTTAYVLSVARFSLWIATESSVLRPAVFSLSPLGHDYSFSFSYLNQPQFTCVCVRVGFKTFKLYLMHIKFCIVKPMNILRQWSL